MPRRIEVKDPLLVGAIVAFVAGWLLIAYVINPLLDYANVLRLQQDGVTIQARVDLASARRQMFIGPEYYTVDYDFEVDGQSYEYDRRFTRHLLSLFGTETRSPFLCGTSRRTRIDCDEALVSQAAWEAASDTRQIEVTYLPDNPWINLPTSRVSDSLSGINLAPLPITCLIPIVIVVAMLIAAGFRRLSGDD